MTMNSYIHTLSLSETRIWISYRGRAINGLKYKNETQEHLEICEGTDYESRGLEMTKWQGILNFWMRMSTSLSNI